MSRVTKNIIILDRGNYTTCTVHLHGGTISSYRVNNKEMLYMGKKTAFNNYSPIRGGIKFAFPYFGSQINGPKHGFARNVLWKLEKGPVVNHDGNIEAVFSLVESEYTKAIWNFKFKICYRLTLCINELRIAVKVANTSRYFPFRFSILTHSVFNVLDVTKCEIHGLSGCNYAEWKSNGNKTPQDPDDADRPDKITIRGPILDLFYDVPPIIEVRNIANNELKLKIISCESTSCDVLIYNTWNKEPETDDEYAVQFYPDEYLYALGIGTGHLCSTIRLEPQNTWRIAYIIQVVDEEQEARIQQLAQLLDNPLQLFKDVCTKTETFS
ncbi:hypothetical protein ABEB36_011943 [Hypothenemus hampei]|uniref:glucose-6-phosphate 1-epimerase n=1 Tax=Hypothenemus hampei TaxID=57062 RepID=A0ABD1E9I9_HYPHA